MTTAEKTQTDEQELKGREAKEKAKIKKAALSDYEGRFANVLKLKQLTDTDAWRQLFKSMGKQIAGHAESLLDHTLGTKDVIYHQQGVRVLRDLLTQIRAPMDALTSFASDMPLFAQDAVKQHATWNAKTGCVELQK